MRGKAGALRRVVMVITSPVQGIPARDIGFPWMTAGLLAHEYTLSICLPARSNAVAWCLRTTGMDGNPLTVAGAATA